MDIRPTEPQLAEQREFMRVHHVFPVEFRVVTVDEANHLSATLACDSAMRFDLAGVPEGPRLSGEHAEWQTFVQQALSEINAKIDRIAEALNLPGDDGPERERGLAHNVSGSGIYLETEERLTAGDLLELRLHLPTRPASTVQVLGQVQREDGESAGARGWGVRFISLNESDREFIIRFTFAKQREEIRSQRSHEEMTEGEPRG